MIGYKLTLHLHLHYSYSYAHDNNISASQIQKRTRHVLRCYSNQSLACEQARFACDQARFACDQARASFSTPLDTFVYATRSAFTFATLLWSIMQKLTNLESRINMTRYPLPGTPYLVPATWYPLRGTQYPVPAFSTCLNIG